MKRQIAIVLLGMLGTGLLMACSASEESGQAPFPLAEPDYTSKRPRDLAPFAGALAALTPERVTELDGVVRSSAIPDLQSAMEAGQLSAEELVTYYVARIQRYDIDRLNAFMELNPDALAIARSLDAERAAGTVRGPLHGIPVLLKDNIATGDQMHTTAGAYALRDWRAGRDAFLVAQLREAGAVILGKANLSEWANYTDPSMPNGFSTLGGQTRHPYGPFDPLGSSAGSAVAVAADLVTVSVGTETQGSIIQPALANGLVGLKTSLGLVSRDHIIPLVDWMDVPGPMGRSVTDVAILLSAMTGVDENDPATSASRAVAGTDFSRFATLPAAQGKRVGIPITTGAEMTAFFDQYNITGELADEQRQVWEEANRQWREVGALLAAQGVTVVEIPSRDIPNAPRPTAALEYGFRDAVDRFFDALGENAPLERLADVEAINAADPANRVPYGQGYISGSVNTAITAAENEALIATNRDETAAAARSLFRQYDLDALFVSRNQFYAAAGYPALAVPNGLDDEGQPVGYVLVGDFMGEAELIAVGYALEQATGGRVPPDLEATMAAIEPVVSGSE